MTYSTTVLDEKINYINSAYGYIIPNDDYSNPMLQFPGRLLYDEYNDNGKDFYYNCFIGGYLKRKKDRTKEFHIEFVRYVCYMLLQMDEYDNARQDIQELYDMATQDAIEYRNQHKSKYDKIDKEM